MKDPRSKLSAAHFFIPVAAGLMLAMNIGLHLYTTGATDPFPWVTLLLMIAVMTFLAISAKGWYENAEKLMDLVNRLTDVNDKLLEDLTRSNDINRRLIKQLNEMQKE